MSFKTQQSAAPGTVVNTNRNRVVSATYRNATAGVQSYTVSGTVTQGYSQWEVRLTHAITGVTVSRYSVIVSYMRRPSPSIADFAVTLARTIAQYSDVRAVPSGADVTLTAPIGYNAVLTPVGTNPWSVALAVNTPATISNVIQPGRLVYVNRLGSDLVVSPFTNNSQAEIGIVLASTTTSEFSSTSANPRVFQLDVMTKGDVWVRNVGSAAVTGTYKIGVAGTLVDGVDIQGMFTHGTTTGTAAATATYRASTAAISGGLLPIVTEDLGVPGGSCYRISLM